MKDEAEKTDSKAKAEGNPSSFRNVMRTIFRALLPVLAVLIVGYVLYCFGTARKGLSVSLREISGSFDESQGTDSMTIKGSRVDYFVSGFKAFSQNIDYEEGHFELKTEEGSVLFSVLGKDEIMCVTKGSYFIREASL